MTEPLRLEHWPAGRLSANPKNWRIHPQGQLSALRSVMGRVGWADAVLWNETTGHLIDGHARLELSKPEDVIPVLVGHWSEADEDFLLTTFDPVGQLAMADAANIATLLADIETSDTWLQYLIQKIQDIPTVASPASRGPSGDGDGDGSPPETHDSGNQEHSELLKKWGVRTGDVWRADGHIICCGDSRAHLYTVQSQLLLCSPPYAQQRSYKDSDMDWNALVPPVICHGALAVKSSGHVLVNLGIVVKEERVLRYWDPLLDAMDVLWCLGGWYVWDKQHTTPQRTDKRLKLTHEWVFHWTRSTSRWPEKTVATLAALNRDKMPTRGRTKDGKSHPKNTSGDTLGRKPDGTRVDPIRTSNRNQDKTVLGSVLQAAPAGAGQDYHDHPAAYSTHFCLPYIEAFTEPGEYVLDPFAGSGTTGMAAHELGRRAYLVEMAPEYVSIILQRFEDRGLKPERDSHIPDTSHSPRADAAPKGRRKVSRA